MASKSPQDKPLLKNISENGRKTQRKRKSLRHSFMYLLIYPAIIKWQDVEL